MSPADRAALARQLLDRGAGGVVPAGRRHRRSVRAGRRSRDGRRGNRARLRHGLDHRRAVEALVPGHRLLALHELHAVPELLPVRRLRRVGRPQDSGAEPEQLQDRVPGLLARVSRSGHHVPEVPARADQRRGGAGRRRAARSDEGGHLGAARRRHLLDAARSQRQGEVALLEGTRRRPRAQGAAELPDRAQARPRRSPRKCWRRCRRPTRSCAKAEAARARALAAAEPQGPETEA